MGVRSFVGERFGRLLVTEFVGRNVHNRRTFNCVCDCGKNKIVTDANLTGKTRSCGCLKKEVISKLHSKPAEHRIQVRKEWESKNKRWLTPSSRLLATERVRKYRRLNSLTINEAHLHRMKSDIQYRLKWNIRNRFKQAVLKSYKKGLAITHLGCSIEDLKKHLESLFLPGMSWDNYGLFGWHIDHVIPLSSYDLRDESQVAKACRYKNLQPLWAKDNLSKGDSV